jgi:hypothetical protein
MHNGHRIGLVALVVGGSNLIGLSADKYLYVYGVIFKKIMIIFFNPSDENYRWEIFTFD